MNAAPQSALDSERLAELKAIVADATPGPWVSLFRAVRITPQFGPPFEMFVGDENDADFIVAARESLPELLAEIDRLRAIMARVRRLCQRAIPADSFTAAAVDASKVLAALDGAVWDRCSRK
jgi:hypothetical protein